MCHDWRVTIHSLPMLWARISVWLNRAEKLPWTRIMQPLALYLRQASTHPLSINFTSDRTGQAQAHRLLRVLAGQETRSRIENLSMCVSNSLLFEISLDRLGWNFPYLCHLNLEIMMLRLLILKPSAYVPSFCKGAGPRSALVIRSPRSPTLHSYDRIHPP